jgi:tetratricopeptide (TPR) repeat protein
VFDYGPFQDAPVGPALAGAVVLLPLLGLTLIALRRGSAAGFIGAVFFLALAPSSSVVPVASQVMAEHRMYLALAAVAAAAVFALHRALGRHFLWPVLALAVAGSALTLQRNRDYRSPLALWTATVRDCPGNPRAWLNLAAELAGAGRWAEAAEHYAGALRLQPDYVAAHYNLGLACTRLRRFAEADFHFAAALRLNPTMTEAAYNWGAALAEAGRLGEAAARFELTVRLDPAHARAYYNLGNTLVELGRLPEAITHFRAAVRLQPGRADYHFNLATALLQSDQAADAVAEYEAVLRLDPTDAAAARNLAAARQLASGK